jgi:hypothetical protein
MLVMRDERGGLVAIGPVPVEYRAAMMGDALEEGAAWMTARDRRDAGRQAGPRDCCRGGRLTGGKPVARWLVACQPGSPCPCRRRSRLADAR